MACCGTGPRKFWLLLWKNYILQKRHKVQTLFEIVLPLLYALLLVYIRSLAPVTEIPEASYYPEFFPRNPIGTFVLGGQYILYSPDTPEVKAIFKIAETFLDQNENATLSDILTQLNQTGLPTSGNLTTFITQLNATGLPIPGNLATLLGNSNITIEQLLNSSVGSFRPKYEFRGYSNEAALLKDYLDNPEYGSKHVAGAEALYVNENPVLAAIIFKTNPATDNEIKYQIRFPAVQHGNLQTVIQPGKWFTHTLYFPFQLPGAREQVENVTTNNSNFDLARLLQERWKANKERGGLPGYWQQGFLFLQSAIDTAVIYTRAKEPSRLLQFNVSLNRYPYPKHKYDKFIFALQLELPLFLVLSFIYSAVSISKSIAHEKERKLKESMKMMGLPNWLHWAAWFTKSIIFLMISVLLMIGLYKYKTGNKNLSVITYGDGSLVFFFLIAYLFSVITFSFLIASFFSTANSASTAAGVLFFLTFFPYMFTQNRQHEMSKGLKLSMSIFSNTAMGFGCQLITMFEGTSAGAQWSTIWQGPSPDDSLTLLDIIAMLFMDGFLYLFMAIYIEGVYPGDYGVPLPWNFPFTKWYWSGKVRGSDEYSAIKIHPESSSQKIVSDSFEKEPDGIAGIQVIGLRKVFGGKVAVNDVYLNFYENQVTALLGHNGAGKTTTMSMITGLFGPTSGRAIVNGFDILTDIQSVRESLGLCPQHDVLFDEMTVEEHLNFFCLLKGNDRKLVQAEVDRMIAAMKLENKRHAQSHTLSGGMKRKLSVGIALVGGSKVVLLDEPTSGMDPGARRSTWDLITTEKIGRTIVLSTHFMDEADLLGDRIAIMANGKVICCGSSLFLKKKYGGGYHLIMVKLPNCKVELVTQLLQKHMPEVVVDQNVGTELSYSLPDEKAQIFPQVFEELEKRKAELGIESYGCSITQMEEVFMRVGEQAERDKEGIPPKNETSQHKPSKHQTINMSKDDMPTIPPSTSSVKLDTSNHDNQTSIQTVDKSATSLPVTQQSNSALKLSSPDYDDRSRSRNEGMTLVFQQLRAMLVKKALHAVRNKILIISQTLVPVTFLVITLILLRTLNSHNTYPREMPLNLYKYTLLGRPVTTMQCTAASDICDAYKGTAELQSKVINIGDTMIEHFIIAESEKNLPRVNFQYIVGVKATSGIGAGGNISTKLKGFFNNQPLHSAPVALNFMYSTLLRHLTGNNDLKLTVSNWPLPFTKHEKVGKLENIGRSEGFQVGFNIAFGMSFLSAGFVVFVIKERETKSKHLQYVSGVKFPIFWLAHWIFDFINYLIPCFGLLIVVTAFESEDFAGLKLQGIFLLVLIMYGWGVIPMMYLFSFLFTVPSTGYTRMVFFNIITGTATILAMVILQIPDLELTHVGEELEWYFMLFPNFNVGYALGQIAINRVFLELCQVLPSSLCQMAQDNPNPCCTKYPIDYLAWKPPGIARNLLYLFVVGCVCHLILYIIESKIIEKIRYMNAGKKHIRKSVGRASSSALEDSDVAAENERIRSTDLEEMLQTDTMILRDLTKYYNRFLAVNSLCLGVKRGECFGLLGVNGAGKTTTFKMLTGDIPITFGDAYITGIGVKSHIKDVQRVIGYCPQFDALIPELTGRETIRLFARLRGTKEHEIDSLVDRLAADLIFSEHIDKPCGTYSGGNKRKLSTALSLIGDPPVIFLDEPTTGMDPVARRHLCNTIIKVRESGTSVILTSHIMEECEALCTRLAIMVNGKFRCLGSTQHLKNKFGDGFTLIAQMESIVESGEWTRTSLELGRRRNSIDGQVEKWERDLQPLRDFIEGSFSDCQLKDLHPGYVHYHIPEDGAVTWGQIFKKMEEAKALFRLEAYSVGQTSLEQVFLGFSQGQCNED